MNTWKKGEMGVGTLIVFIAFLLVAAIAAGVLLSTITTLQQKSLITGMETKAEISTHLTAVQLVGENGTDSSLENLTLIAKLSPGSDAVYFNETLVSVGLTSGSVDLEYHPSARLYGVGNPNATRFFTVQYLVQGSEFSQHYLSRGDVVKIFMVPPSNITADQDVRVKLVPKVGSATEVFTRAPASISRDQHTLFP